MRAGGRELRGAHLGGIFTPLSSCLSVSACLHGETEKWLSERKKEMFFVLLID